MTTAVLSSFPPLFGYRPRQHLASGGQSTVYRALHLETSHLAAIKVVPFPLHQQAEYQAKAKQLVREMRIHETLKHRNILQLFGGETREAVVVRNSRGNEQDWPTGLYMVLDLADGGDLFDKITPDLGIDEEIAHFYFRQLIAGLKYLGKQGICHRDVKPENCLLDGDGNLKISDFGLATVFKYKGQERLLKDRCGSPPYAAPELAHTAPYAAEPVDVWSAGVLLFALLVGNTPWDEPTQNSPEFMAFVDGSLLQMDPWSRIRGGALDVLLKMLTLDPNARPRIKDIEQLDWYRQPNQFLIPETGLCANGAEVFRRLAMRLHSKGFVGQPDEEYQEIMQAAEMAASQAAANAESPHLSQAQGLNAMQAVLSQRGLDPGASFRGSMQLYSRLSMAPTQKTNANLSRFFSMARISLLVESLRGALERLGHSSVTESVKPFDLSTMQEPPSRSRLGDVFVRIKVKTVDRRGQNLQFAIHVSKGFLPDSTNVLVGGGGSYGGARSGGLLSQSMRMDVDSDEEEEAAPATTTTNGAEAGQEGYDVTCWKKVAEPIELKKVWKGVLDHLPRGLVAAT
ncbi:hypothetical protein JCM10212_000114 [Sporobolomyces blumeae]